MTIGIDARMLGPKQGGIGRYVEQLTKNLMQIFCHPRTRSASINSGGDPERRNKWIPDQVGNDKNKVNFVVFLRKENWDLVPEAPNVKKVLADIPWYGWREQLLLPKIIRREKIDLMHFPHWNVPIFYNRPFVVTIHDLLLLHYSTRAASTLGPISYFFKNIAYRIVLNHAITKSKHIIAPSEYTKNDVVKNFNVAPEKITVTYLAPMPLDSRLRGNDKPVSHLGISKPYVLYVGVAYPHKNLEELIKAWHIFCAQHGNNYQLVLAGRKNYFYERLEKSACRNEGIIFTGYVPDEDLPALYQNASLYVFPSLYEGFGLPPFEAMQYGVPVISSNAACLPEILKDSALYFDPEKTIDIAAAIRRGLTDKNLRQSLTQKSVQLIHNYSWITTARLTLEVYQKVV